GLERALSARAARTGGRVRPHAEPVRRLGHVAAARRSHGLHPPGRASRPLPPPRGEHEPGSGAARARQRPGAREGVLPVAGRPAHRGEAPGGDGAQLHGARRNVLPGPSLPGLRALRRPLREARAATSRLPGGLPAPCREAAVQGRRRVSATSSGDGEVRVLYIVYWGALEPLGQALVLPAVKRLSELGARITLVTFEKPADAADAGEVARVREQLVATGVRWRPLTYHKRPKLPATAFDCA